MLPPQANRYQARVSAPSRLHFGLLSLGDGAGRHFGGLGAMIQRLTVQESDRFEVQGPLADRAAEFARRLTKALGHPDDPFCRIEIESAPPEHVGLGTGTQLGLAVAAALHPLLSSQPASVAQLAQWVGRGVRSAIGTHGFAAGGLIFEQGKLASEAVSPLTARVELPRQWRFILFWPGNSHGLWGEQERAAFCSLQAIQPQTTESLLRIATQEILPAAATGDAFAFGDALFRYGHMSGNCFAQHQQGAFASTRVAGLVDAIRKLGIPGAGQSSWGPTVYAIVPDQSLAEALIQQLVSAGRLDDTKWMVVAPNNSGATVTINKP